MAATIQPHGVPSGSSFDAVAAPAAAAAPGLTPVVVVVVTVVVDVTVLAAGVGDVVVSVTVEAGGGGVVTVADDVTVVVDACVVVTVTVESGTVAVEVVWVSAGPVDVDRVVSGGVVVAGRDCVGAGRLDSVVPVVDGVVVTERVVPDTWPEPPHEATAKPNAASRHAAPTARTVRDHCCGTGCSSCSTGSLCRTARRDARGGRGRSRRAASRGKTCPRAVAPAARSELASGACFAIRTDSAPPTPPALALAAR